ncbi:MAG: DNA polymerase II large subunit [Candidatus Odinarchaeia archaeon]
MSESVKKYLNEIEAHFKELYEIASKARSRGLDPSLEPEIQPAEDVAARVEGLIGPKGVAERIRELSKTMDREEVAFKIAEEIVNGRFGKFSEEEAAERSIRCALAILTEAITAAPIEGIASVKIKDNLDGTKYLAIYFAGPIRAAGGTAAAQTVLIGDFVRRKLNLDKYKPTEEEIERYVEETELYDKKVNLQYPTTPEERRLAAKNLPVEVTGEATEKTEVSGYRNLKRVETNCLRGGAILVFNDGLIAKSSKLLKIVNQLGLPGWEWLADLKRGGEEGKNESETTEIKPNLKYIAEVIGGRPVFSYPGEKGGFRLRYGRSRNTGLAAMGIHPATMVVLDSFLAPGTHLRTERPGKGSIVLPVDTIEGPIVLLENGDVVRVNTYAQAKELKDKVKKILFLGDLLFGYGEYLENNHPLVPSGYVEEWFVKELINVIKERFEGSLKKAADIIEIPAQHLEELINNPLETKITGIEAVKIARVLNIPLHPYYTYHWHDVTSQDILLLRNRLMNGEKRVQNGFISEIIIPSDIEVKRILEEICLPHKVIDGNIVIGEHAPTLAETLNLYEEKRDIKLEDDPLVFVNRLSRVKIRAKAPLYIGARMGRPEKAKKRVMKPLVHCLFPIGISGGPRRSVLKALEHKVITVEMARRKCPKCGAISVDNICPVCNTQTIIEFTCPVCGITSSREKCPKCGCYTRPYGVTKIDIEDIYYRALKNLHIKEDVDVKCVRGMTSKYKIPERLEKGILRAKYDLSVNKDGTIRFDMTNAPLTHFKPKEVGVSVEKLISLGYTHDIYGHPLSSEDQILELKVQDIIISHKCGEYLLNVAKFIDELLSKFYNLPPFYRVNSLDDIVGHLVIGLAPHTSAGIVGRIIGFTTANLCYAHPYWHAAKRRNCDSDEDSVILALDALLNFSKFYLPESRGGMMDAPLVVSLTLNPSEVDSEAYNLDCSWEYPIKLYEASLKCVNPKEFSTMIDIIETRLGKPEQYEGIGFTHNTSDINLGPKATVYKKLKTMEEKVEAQLKLGEKIRAVKLGDMAYRILSTHLMRDIIGNLSKFTKQKFRCIKCNSKFRRPPLIGKCPNCGARIVSTVYKGNIEKYLSVAKNMIEKFNLPNYVAQRLDLINMNIGFLFSTDESKDKQATLSQFI